MNSTSPIPPNVPGAIPVWLAAVRPRTLSISATPVIVGSTMALAQGAHLAWAPSLAALACAVAIQVGTNLYNDAADYESGNDRADRIGPLRVTAAGWLTGTQVRRAAIGSFVAALCIGLYLVAVGGWPILAIGVASLAAGWAYSGGPRPISHSPLGEVFVLVFFGIAAVGGSAWLQDVAPGLPVLLAGAIVGLPAAAVLLVNNYRDLESDLRAGRRTLVAQIGRPAARGVYGTLMLLPYGLLAILATGGLTGAWLGWVALPLSLHAIRALRTSAIDSSLNGLLAATARAGFVLGAGLAVGLLGQGAIR